MAKSSPHASRIIPLALVGYTPLQIAEELGITPGCVRALLFNARIDGRIPADLKFASKPGPTAAERAEDKGGEAYLNYLKRANIMHLVDLKRAQHSPKKTEFKNTSERPMYVRATVTGSYMGSPGAMCVGN